MSEHSKTNAEVRAELSELARPVAQELRRSLVQRETTRLACGIYELPRQFFYRVFNVK